MKNAIYLCGKMSGLEDFNYPRFNEVTAELRQQGRNVFNPAEINGEDDWTWVEYMRAAIKGLVQCTEVYVLSGWETSKGAKIEIQLAHDLGMTVKFELSE